VWSLVTLACNLVVVGLLSCRYITAHVPATCVAPTLDTLRVVQNAAGDTLALELRQGCAIWQALDDSTKRWDSAGRRLP
jgi:hypothetical protein